MKLLDRIVISICYVCMALAILGILAHLVGIAIPLPSWVGWLIYSFALPIPFVWSRFTGRSR